MSFRDDAAARFQGKTMSCPPRTARGGTCSRATRADGPRRWPQRLRLLLQPQDRRVPLPPAARVRLRMRAGGVRPEARGRHARAQVDGLRVLRRGPRNGAYYPVTSGDTCRPNELRPRLNPAIRVAQVTAGTRCYTNCCDPRLLARRLHASMKSRRSTSVSDLERPIAVLYLFHELARLLGRNEYDNFHDSRTAIAVDYTPRAGTARIVAQ